LPEHLFTDNQKICLLPEAVLGDLQRLYDGLAALPQTDELLLIGRRDLRTNNSWMHNSQRLVKGQDRCALFIHPQDAERLGLADRSKASIRSRVGSLEVDVKYQTDIMPGVVSLPHGWGHDRPGIALRVAQTNPGISVNDITDDQRVDKLSGNAIFNGIPVTVAAV
jgi:anaerobic selenocysteine-containing dehydrogenase